MFLPLVEIARICRRLRLVQTVGAQKAGWYWDCIDFSVQDILNRNRFWPK